MDPQPPDPATESPPSEPDSRPPWKEELLRTLHDMVEALPDEAPPEPPTPEDGMPPPGLQLPTLEEFYKALIALEANTRKNVQKTNAALETVARNLRALQRQMSQIEERGGDPAPSADPTLWLSLDAQLRRMLERLANPPPPAPLGLGRKWQSAWLEVANGAQIIQHSLAKVLDEQGVTIQIPPLGASFDPARMEAVKVSPRPEAVPSAPATDQADQAEVIEVIEPAYYQGGQLIRAARVHVRR